MAKNRNPSSLPDVKEIGCKGVWLGCQVLKCYQLAAKLFPVQFILRHQAEKYVDEIVILEDCNVYSSSIVTLNLPLVSKVSKRYRSILLHNWLEHRTR